MRTPGYSSRDAVSAEDDKASKLILEKVRPFSDIPRELWIQFESKDDYSQKEKRASGGSTEFSRVQTLSLFI